MAAKRSRFGAFIHMKCPRCHEGNMYKQKNMYNLSKIHEMPEHCPVCREPFSQEPGFYYGAMYVNYAFGTALFLLSWAIFTYLGIDIWIFIISYISTIVVLTPVFFRYSRVLYLYFFVAYNPDAIKNKIEKV